MKDLLVLDLDGTITKSDCLTGFSFFMIRNKKEIRHILIIPLLILLKLGIIDNIKFKKLYAFILLNNYRLKYIGQCTDDYINTPDFQKTLNNKITEFTSRYDSSERIIISSNFTFLVEPIAKMINVQTTISVKASNKDERYTGYIDGLIPYENDKVVALNNFLKTRTYSKKIGIANDKSDLPLLNVLDEGFFVDFDRKKNNTIIRKI